MKRILTKILCTTALMIILTGNNIGQDRALRIGFQTSPVISWISNNDNLIVKNGGNIGLKLGTTADVYFKENYSFTLGINLAFHQGGEFLYELGGNYLPQTEVSDPAKLGPEPKVYPDGTKIRYNLQYVEIPIGLKFRSKEFGYIRYFVEAPILTFSFLTRGRGNIETDEFSFSGEDIYKDLNVFNIFWGLGTGVEYSISENNALIGGLYFQNSLLDFTKNKGYRAIPDPDTGGFPYLLQDDDSRATISNIILRIGIIF